MKARVFKKLIKEVTLMHLETGDTVLVSLKTNRIVSKEEIVGIQKQLKSFFPKNKVLVVPDDFNVSIIRES